MKKFKVVLVEGRKSSAIIEAENLEEAEDIANRRAVEDRLMVNPGDIGAECKVILDVKEM